MDGWGKSRRVGRFLLTLLVTLLTVGSCALGASAATQQELYEQQYDASGAQELWEAMPEQTRRFLDNLGIDGIQPDGLSSLKPDEMLSNLFALLQTQASTPLRTGLILLGVVLLASLMDGGGTLIRDEGVRSVFSSVCVLAAGGAVLLPLSETIRTVSETADSVSVFMGSFVPVYVGILLTGGQTVTAVSFQTVTLFAAELMAWFVTHMLVPALTVSLVLGVVGSVTGGLKLDSAASLLNKTCTWALALTASLFAGLLSLQRLVGAAADSLGGRAIRFSLASLVPVVGNALSEAFTSLRGCLGLLQTTVGGFGMLTVILVILPPLLTCFGWTLCFGLCGTVAEMLGNRALPTLCRAAAGVVRTMTGVLAVCGLFMIVSVTLVSTAWGAVA